MMVGEGVRISPVNLGGVQLFWACVCRLFSEDEKRSSYYHRDKKFLVARSLPIPVLTVSKLELHALTAEGADAG